MGGLAYGGGGVEGSLIKLQCQLIDPHRAGVQPENRFNWWMDICAGGVAKGQRGDCQEAWPSQPFRNPCSGPHPRHATKTRPSFSVRKLSSVLKAGLRDGTDYINSRGTDLQLCWGVDVWSFPAPCESDGTGNINERLSQRTELLNVAVLLVVATICNQPLKCVSDKSLVYGREKSNKFHPYCGHISLM